MLVPYESSARRYSRASENILVLSVGSPRPFWWVVLDYTEYGKFGRFSIARNLVVSVLCYTLPFPRVALDFRLSSLSFVRNVVDQIPVVVRTISIIPTN